MNMKAYPLIYSRILNDDYPHGFLARPKDLNTSAALKYVIPAMEHIQHAEGVRHSVFPAGDYLIYGGVASIAGKLVERILQSKAIGFPYEEYQADKAGRPLIFFIGFAVRKYGLIQNELPDIDLYGTYQIYLSHLAKQWYEKKATTEFPDELELKIRSYTMKSAPQILEAAGKHILCDYREDYFQETVDYYFACMAWKRDGDFSFLSNVLPDDAAKSPFAYISPYNCTPEECARIIMGSSVSVSYVSSATRSRSKRYTNNVLNREIAGISDRSSGAGSTSSQESKKKAYFRSSRCSRNSLGLAIGILAVVMIVVLLLFLMTKVKKVKDSHPNQTAHAVSEAGNVQTTDKHQTSCASISDRQRESYTGYSIGMGGTPARSCGRDCEGRAVESGEKNLIPFEDLVSQYPELRVLEKLQCLTVLLSAPDFPRRSELACLSSLASLSKIKELSSLEVLQTLNQLSEPDSRNRNLKQARKEEVAQMGELFGQYAKVAEDYQRQDLEVLCQYEEHYMRLLRNYAGEIKEIQSMMERLRKERDSFYREILPETERQIEADNILSDEAKAQWIREFQTNMESSFRISEELINHYVTANLEEFKGMLKKAIERV